MLKEVTSQRLFQVLQDHWGYRSFRPLQSEAIENVIAGRDSVVVLPTGGGKSLCYQVPAVCSRGLAVVVSPLISLMKDQVDALTACGVNAACVNSTLSAAQQRAVADRIAAGEVRLLYVAPERLVTERMLDFLTQSEVSFFAIDEAHCISQWGHDFRPEYRRLSVLKDRFPHAAVHAFTATATQRVREDIADQLGLVKPEYLVGRFDRPNLQYRVKRKAGRFDQIQDVLTRHPNESGIVYCISRKEVDQLTATLCEHGIRAVAYHAGLPDEQRHSAQDAFLQDRAEIVVATVAFGMGIDKSNVRFVIHSGMPKSLENYQQEAGRAGRDGLEADCLLLYSGSDIALWKRLMSDLEPDAYASAEDSLNAMAAYCTGAVCRHKSLVEHFGQAFETVNCGACDVCLGELDLLPDSLTVSQKILSCVVRLGQKYGAEYTAQVLLGSEDERILNAGHHRLSTFGLMQGESKKAIRGWIDQLLGQGFLNKTGEYGVLQLSTTGRKLLKGDAEPRLLRPAPAASKRARRATSEEGWNGVDRQLFERLRTMRAALAAEKQVPPYIIFGDETLRELARRRPTTRAALLDVRGIGPAKADRFGQAVLEIISGHCGENGVASEVQELASRSLADDDTGQATAAATAVFPLFRAGRSIESIASELGRATSTVHGYLQQYLRSEGVTDATPWVDTASTSRIRDAFEECGTGRLRPIFEHLGGDISYDAIRIVAECHRNLNL